ncbi:PREDICTED: uncharacterized protein LOC107064130 [Polistes dominula]|uniref:Uncharacterized protein LOC107064130 n=1 Tax=Polistes dominula TaxID=743375 RepID=A0ABM1HVI0_POLDO|nr:PREDICTED: uncharacterized protein LOC107064130 [Polistes dominula]
MLLAYCQGFFRPVLKEVNSERDSHETDASSVMPKSVEMRGEINKSNSEKSDVCSRNKSDNEKSDVCKRNKSDSDKSDLCKRNKSDSEKSDMVRSREKIIVDSIKSKIIPETDIAVEPKSKDIKEGKSKDSIGPIRSCRIKQRSPISYDEMEIDNDYLLTTQSIVYSIPM